MTYRNSILIILILFVFLSCKKEESVPERPKSVANQLPVCEITTPQQGEQIQYSEIVPVIIEASDIDGSISRVEFFLDGLLIKTSDEVPLLYEWNTSGFSIGNHILKAKVLDQTYDEDIDEVSVTIIEHPDKPQAQFSISDTLVGVALPVQFTDATGNDPRYWLWDFGDGHFSSDQNPVHTYRNIGVYTVKLLVSNSFGTDTITQYNSIEVFSRDGETGNYIDDRDTNSYATIQIGDQTWFAENLDYQTETGSSRIEVEFSSERIVASTYYTWEMAQDVCPDGWLLPDTDAWERLRDYLVQAGYNYDGSTVDIKIGKSMATTFGWSSSNDDGDVGYRMEENNESGFSAAPMGYILGGQNEPVLYSFQARFWSSSANYTDEPDLADYFGLSSDVAGVSLGVSYRESKNFKMNVRCLQDN